jgi:membrane-associated protease RseP (regulator of RpoE activity)
VLIAIMVMVAGHEFGHFITAKRSGMLVTDFFVGFGPVLWSRQIGETRYGVRAFLLGGYVKVPGMTWDDDVDPALEGRTYRAASYPKKVLFASAGSLMHVAMALVLAWSAFFFIGVDSPQHVEIAALPAWQGHRVTVAQAAGIHVGDEIVRLDSHPVTSPTQVVTFLHDHADRRISLELARGSRRFWVSLVPVDARTLRQDGTPLATGSHSVGMIGVELEEGTVSDGVVGSGFAAVRMVGSTLGQAVQGIGRVFSVHEFTSLFHQVVSSKAAQNRANQATRPSSIVGVVRVATQAADAGVGPLLSVLIVVNLFVGVLNMLPFLPLDGGYVALATYERIRSIRHKGYHADSRRLAPLIYAVVAVLLALFLMTLYLDLLHPLANPFK